MRILFILKNADGYGTGYGQYATPPSGLLHSAQECAAMLEEVGYTTKVVQVVDNNSIDKEVTSFKPDIAIVEALWVVPEKFDILSRLHPKVKWVVRIHSKFDFLAGEGVAMQWITQYPREANTWIAFNDKVMVAAFNALKGGSNNPYTNALYMPTFYPSMFHSRPELRNSKLQVACLGAIRPLKNQLVQAVAAHECAAAVGQDLQFYINSSRVEMRGDPILKNIRALFDYSGQELVELPWMPADQLTATLRTMDIGLQVSLSETFNIMAADMVAAGLPIVVSDQIQWATRICKADVDDPADITNKMLRALRWPRINLMLNRSGLEAYGEDAQEAWIKSLKVLARIR